MARIVDKEQKRRDIALACKDMVITGGIASLSVASLAKAAGIGKGTIYEYFQNKEEIVFEIVTSMLEQNQEKLQNKLKSAKSTKEKVKKLSEFFYSPEDADLRKLYKEFTSITLVHPTPEMIEFQTQSMLQYYEWFSAILQEGIDKGEITPKALDLCRGIFVIGKGMFIVDATTSAIENLEEEFELFLDALFDILEVK